MAQDDVSVRSSSRTEADGGSEREVIDEDRVRSDDLDRPTRGLDGFPEQVPRSRLCLVAKRRDHPHAGGLEEFSQVVVLAGRLLFGTGDPVIQVLESIAHDLAGRPGRAEYAAETIARSRSASNVRPDLHRARARRGAPVGVCR